MAPIIDSSTILEFEALPKGTYNCRLQKFENKRTNADDGDNVNLRFTVEDGELAGRIIFYTLSLKPGALWKFKQTCLALGAEPKQFVGLFDTDEILNSIQGNECRVAVSIQQGGDYDGRQQVDSVKAPGFAA